MKFCTTSTRFIAAFASLGYCISGFATVPLGSDSAQAPVYLYRDSGGNISTYDYQERNLGGVYVKDVVSRAVNVDEVRLIQSHGYIVAFIDEKAQMKASPHAQLGLDAQIEGATQLSSLPTSFNIVEINTVIYGNIWVSGGSPPIGTTTQWLDYNWSASSPYPDGGHFVSMVLLDPASMSTSPSANGVAIGGIGVRGGCGANGYPGYNSQIESAWTTDNILYPSTCQSTAISNGVLYAIGVSGTTSSYAAYTMRNTVTGVQFNSSAPYTNADRPSTEQITPTTAQGGIIVAAVFPGANDWQLYFTSVGTGWF
jgi:hypothetical protein